MPDPLPKNTDTKKNLFAAPADKVAILLFPFDANERAQIENMLAERSDVDQAKLPRLVTEIPTGKINSNHVIFSVVRVPTKLGFAKQPAEFKLVVSPALDCANFMVKRTGEDFGADIDVGSLVDEIQKHVRPFVAKLSDDKTLKIGAV